MKTRNLWKTDGEAAVNCRRMSLPAMFMKEQAISQDLRYHGQKGFFRQGSENTQVKLSSSWHRDTGAEKMLKMQDDPAMFMKKNGRATECRSIKRLFPIEFEGY